MTPALLDALAALRAKRRAAVLATRLSDGSHRLFDEDALGGTAPDTLQAAAGQALRAGRAETATIDGVRWFLDVHLPPSRLLIVGAVHVAQSLAPLAVIAGWTPLVIDPRSAFATAERFPGIALDPRWPDEAIDALAPDRSTALALLTHDPKLDDPAIASALRSDAFYIGTLGSRRTHASRLARLRADGHEEPSLARLRGPVGLPLGARTPAEIAVSILAEIVAVRRGSALAVKA